MLPEGIQLVSLDYIENEVVTLDELKPGESFIIVDKRYKDREDYPDCCPVNCMKAENTPMFPYNTFDLQFGTADYLEEDTKVMRAGYLLYSRECAEQEPFEHWKYIKKNKDGSYCNLPTEDKPILITADNIVSIDTLVGDDLENGLKEIWFENLGYGHELEGIGWRLLPEEVKG